ncbi:MAG TPA: peptidylprolyl isomerase [Devosiaceae bacterium]
MTQAKQGDTVRIHYRGSLTDGTQFDSSEGRDPLEFVLGSGQIIKGLDAEVEGMEVGQKSKVTIPSDQAYGARDPEQVQEVPRSAIPAEIDLSIGMPLQASMPDGRQVQLIVAEIADDTVKLDANHPLAGQDLVFEVELVEIV